MAENKTNYYCANCKDNAELFCDCSNIYICANCIGSHLLKNVSFKHHPVLLSEHLANPLAHKKIDLKSAIQSKLSNELLELEEFRKISLQKISEILQITEKKLLETFEKLMNSVSDEIDKAQRDIRNALALLKIPDAYPNEIISFFNGCKNVSEVRELPVVHKILNIKFINIEEFLSESIDFRVKVSHDKNLENRSKTPKSSDRTASDLQRRNTYLSIETEPDRNEEDPEYLSLKAPMTSERKCVTPIKGFERFDKTDYSIFEKRTQLNNPILAYFYPNSNKFALFNVIDASLKIIEVPHKTFLKHSAWSFSEGGKIVQTGGLDSSPHSEVFIYNLSTESTQKSSSLNCKRFNHSQISYADFVYVIGGFSKSPLKTVERMNLLDLKWKKIGKLNFGRSNPACCSYRNKIYIAGGEETKSIETFDTISKKFSLVSLLLPAPGKWAMLSYDEKLILLKKENVYNWDGGSCSMKKTAKVQSNDWTVQGEACCLNNEIFFVCQNGLYRYDLVLLKIYLVTEFL